jgi:hypothetical protein
MQRRYASRPTTRVRAVWGRRRRADVMQKSLLYDRDVALAPIWRNAMTTRSQIGLALLAGFAIGAAAVQGLHAAGSAPAYVVTEIGISDLDAYQKEYPLSPKPRSRRLAAAS